MFDRVLVERFAAETKTKSGLMIPDKAQGKVLEATVVAVGDGARKVSDVKTSKPGPSGFHCWYAYLQKKAFMNLYSL